MNCIHDLLSQQREKLLNFWNPTRKREKRGNQTSGGRKPSLGFKCDCFLLSIVQFPRFSLCLVDCDLVKERFHVVLTRVNVDLLSRIILGTSSRAHRPAYFLNALSHPLHSCHIELFAIVACSQWQARKGACCSGIVFVGKMKVEDTEYFIRYRSWCRYFLAGRMIPTPTSLIFWGDNGLPVLGTDIFNYKWFWPW
jgi:hypothetical protein